VITRSGALGEAASIGKSEIIPDGAVVDVAWRTAW
jgi:hypothetical protein